MTDERLEGGTYEHLGRTQRVEPSAGHAWLREHCPVHRVDAHDPPFFVVSRAADVSAVCLDAQRWRNGDGPGVEYQPGGVLGSTDGEPHDRQRLVLWPSFKPAAIAELEPRLAALADELFDGFEHRGHGDLVHDLAGPFPAIAIAELLGVPPEDRDRFRAWSDDIVIGLGGEELEAMERTRVEIAAYLGARIDDRLAALSDAGRPAGPGALGDVIPDDVLSRMALAAHDHGLLSRGEMVHLGLQLLVAGHETTTSLIGLLVHRLLQRPDLLDALRADRSLVPVAVEEALRFDSPVQGLFRTNPEPAQLHGVDIPARAKVQVLFASANRDETVWDDPDEFRLDRDPAVLRRHWAFGKGIHFCIGSHLARLEARLALDRVLDRLPGLALDGEPDYVRPFILRGLRSLPVRWTV